MGRRAIVSRESIIAAALRLLDAEGLDGLSVERIGAEVGVRGPSLYHHFADKAEILTAVAGLVLGDLRMTDAADEDWRRLLVDTAVTFYRRVIEHPRAAAILMEHVPAASAVAGLGLAARALTEAGIDPVKQALLLEGCEKLAWGWALHRASAAVGGDRRGEHLGGVNDWQELAVVFGARDLAWPDDALMLERSLEAFVDGVLAA